MQGTNVKEIMNKPIDASRRMVDVSGVTGRIRPEREALHISRLKAAAFCGVSETSFYKLELGVTRKIRQGFYDKLCEMLGWDNGEV